MRFSDLSEQQVLALAISSEEDDARIYRGFAKRLQDDYPGTAAVFADMANEEDQHRIALIELHQKRFGDTIPLIRREHVSGFYARSPLWLSTQLTLDQIRHISENMETASRTFYENAEKKSTDADTRRLLGDLAAVEADHQNKARTLSQTHLASTGEQEEETAHRKLILTLIQPGLAGLMDGSVSTLAPVFATAFATGNTWTTFLVGLAASIGAGISMGFTEAVSDDGQISGRGSPVLRGVASGVMTALGGLGHTIPYLLSDFWVATFIAFFVVAVELCAIAWIQSKYMETPLLRATFQVVLGGSLVFAAGVIIGGG
ncbi:MULTISPECIES: iron exporter MbfA [unclassified Pseudovibrio]|uniref:iron exporter MbfA n=1 Tax=unclassified Pseudovibrio TaxID=2627060 RepID=UPI000A42BFA5|nr:MULTISPECIES: ferritin family protein [unclassified Pseudovibrio]